MKGNEVHERDILPSELRDLAKRLTKSSKGGRFRRKVKKELQAQMEQEMHLKENERKIRGELERHTARFLDHRLSPLLEITRAFAAFLGAPSKQADRPFRELVRLWVKILLNGQRHFDQQFNHFF